MESGNARFKKSVFISHASKNFKLADELREALESVGVSCWIAPRDIPFGYQYGTAIVEALRDCTITLLLLTEEANQSKAVENEIERAFGYQKVIVPIRLREIKPATGLEFFISNAQWVDAIVSPLKSRVDQIVNIVHAIEMNNPVPAPAPEKRTLMGTLERFLEKTLRHKMISAISAFLILALIGGLGIYMQSRTHIDLTGIEHKIDKVKLETSEDPRKELANRGVSWNQSNLSKAINDSDEITVELFLAGGMPLTEQNIGSAFEKNNVAVIGSILSHANIFKSDNCNGFLTRLSYSELEKSSSNQTALVKNLCSSAQVKEFVAKETASSEKYNQASIELINEENTKRKSVPDCMRIMMKNNGQDLTQEAQHYTFPNRITLRTQLIEHIHRRLPPAGDAAELIGDVSFLYPKLSKLDIEYFVKDYCQKLPSEAINIYVDEEGAKKWKLLSSML